nr:MAG TPA: pepsin inhibitor 3 [Caudoviricetes sp.]
MRILDNNIYRDMTEQEIAEIKEYQPENEQPTEFDRLEAQVAYTALMTDTLLTEED